MTGPQEQEKTIGHVLMHVSGDVHAEISTYNGKVYFSVRRWFRADDGKWYRTKNGLHLKYDEMIEVLAQAEKIAAFGITESKHFNAADEHGVKSEASAENDVEY